MEWRENENSNSVFWFKKKKKRQKIQLSSVKNHIVLFSYYVILPSIAVKLVQNPHLSSHINRNANNHGWYGYACNEGNANRGANKCA